MERLHFDRVQSPAVHNHSVSSSSTPSKATHDIIHKVSITVKCRNLLQQDVFTPMCPVVGLFEEDPHTRYRFHLLDQTEVLSDELNPNFEHEFLIEHRPGTNQQVSFRVYDGSARVINADNFIGSAVVNLEHLVDEHKPNAESIYNLENYVDPTMNDALRKGDSTLFLRYKPHSLAQDGKMKAELSFKCIGLPPVLSGEPDRIPVLALFSRLASQTSRAWRYEGQTEQCNDDINPIFSKRLVVGCDAEEHKISVYDTNTEKVSEFNRIGSLVVRMANLIKTEGQQSRLKLQLSKHTHSQHMGPGGGLVEITCIRKIEPHRDQRRKYIESVTQCNWLEKQVDEGAHRVAMREVVIKLENMVTFGRGCVRHFHSSARDIREIHLFYRKINKYGEPRMLHWCKKGEREETRACSMGLSNVVAVVTGKQTKAFKNRSVWGIPDHNCFSIITPDNILNIEMAHNRLRDVWMFAIMKIMKEANQKPELYGLGQYKGRFESELEQNETADSFLITQPFAAWSNSPITPSPSPSPEKQDRNENS